MGDGEGEEDCCCLWRGEAGEAHRRSNSTAGSGALRKRGLFVLQVLVADLVIHRQET